MTEDRLPLAELLEKAGDADFLRAVAEAVLQLLMESDAEGLIGAGRHERSPGRLNHRNGYRDRALDTRLGTLQLRVPKLRQGSYFPPFLEPRKVSEKALVAVIQEAWIGGVSTRRVDELVQAMGAESGARRNIPGRCGNALAVNGNPGWGDGGRDASGAGGAGAAGRAQGRGAELTSHRGPARPGRLDDQP